MESMDGEGRGLRWRGDGDGEGPVWYGFLEGGRGQSDRDHRGFQDIGPVPVGYPGPVWVFTGSR